MSNLFDGAPPSAPLFERYRPRSWSEVIGQDKAVRALLALRDKGQLSGRAYWLSGKSGTGKTTIARLLAADVADEFMTTEVDATGLTVAALAIWSALPTCPAGAPNPAAPSSSTKRTACGGT